MNRPYVKSHREREKERDNVTSIRLALTDFAYVVNIYEFRAKRR